MKAFAKQLFYGLFGAFIFRRAARGAVYLTFDDGPHPHNTAKILALLERYQARATFFMIGEQMVAHPEVVEAAIAGGHTIGYHSWGHKSLKKLNAAQVREDFERVRELSARFDYPIRLYRPPFGDLTPTGLLQAVARRWRIAMWSLDCRDSFDSLARVKENVAPERLRDGDILLFHDDYEHVEELMDATLSRYRSRGLRCRAL